jgi:threonine dehydratase
MSLPAKRKSESRLSIDRIAAAVDSIDAVFLNSPQFESDALSVELGMRVVLKVETVNPIRSFKGRGAEFFISQLGDDSGQLVCASAGNFGQGLAFAARKRGIGLVVYAAENANAAKIARMRQLGAEVRLFGPDFDAAKRKAGEFAQEAGARFVVDGLEPAVSEGAGTIAIEWCRWPTPFDFALVPLGDGALLAGIATWMKAHSPATRMIGVCAAGSPAMELSWRSRELRSTESANTIADGIATREPVPEALADLRNVVDEILLVDDHAIIKAMQMSFRLHGFVVEPAGAAGLAAAFTHNDKFRNANVVVPLTGGNMTPEQIRKWLL